ncbi:MAG: Tm-1-like ATP-binding domain-containing protein [Dehalococcoidia bacterium]|nr:MAG: Tm-1-like ATP-binding domain-containing protein [Dehalococcoidia bacterium]
MPKTIVIPVTLDTKGEETDFVKEQIARRGHNTIVIDVGVLGVPQTKADISREEIARAGGSSLPDLVAAAEQGADRTKATNIMIKGVQKTVKELHSAGRLDGIFSLGGSTGAAIGTSAMSVLPIGVPKLMVGTGFELQFVGHKDIAILQAPADILGLNSIMKQTLASAAGAIVGMVEAELDVEVKPLVGITALGVTTPAVMKIRPLLEAQGYESIAFHTDTQILDELVREGRISGIIDLTTFEVMIPLAFHLPEVLAEGRLSPAGERGLPQVIIPGGLDMFIFPGTRETVPAEYKERILHVHGPDTVLVRTTREEVGKAAKILAGRANKATGPVAIVNPTRGFSSVDIEGQHFYDPDADAAFAQVVRETAQEGVDIIEIEAHINDNEFAAAAVDTFNKLTRK